MNIRKNYDEFRVCYTRFSHITLRCEDYTQAMMWTRGKHSHM